MHMQSTHTCAGGGKPAETTKPSDTAKPTETGAPANDAANPFGLQSPSKVEAIIFKGGYGIAYAEFAGKLVEKNHEGVTVSVSPTTEVAKELQPRFTGGNPPDVIDNAGKGKIGLSAILSQLEDLTPVVDAPSIEGTKIRDTLYAGALEPGTSSTRERQSVDEIARAGTSSRVTLSGGRCEMSSSVIGTPGLVTPTKCARSNSFSAPRQVRICRTASAPVMKNRSVSGPRSALRSRRVSTV